MKNNYSKEDIIKKFISAQFKKIKVHINNKIKHIIYMRLGTQTNLFVNQLFKYPKQYLQMLLLNYKEIIRINKKK